MSTRIGGRVALLSVLGALLLATFSLASSPVAAKPNDKANKNSNGRGNGNSDDGGSSSQGSSTQGCNQNKETPEGHYDAKCDGSASENGGGSGGGGRPCAGCVGKADNKNPPGQSPDENDHNKGYECDDNGGVGARRGSGNPAHTGCREKSGTTPTPSGSTAPPGGSGNNPPTDNETTPPDCPPNSNSPRCVSPSPSVCDKDKTMPGIQECENSQSPEPCDEDETMAGIQPCVDDDNVLGGQIRPGGDRDETEPSVDDDVVEPGVLPFTGASIATFLLAAGAMISGGAFLVRRRRS